MIQESQLEAYLRALAETPPPYEWATAENGENCLSRSGMFHGGDQVALNVHPTGYGPPIPEGMDIPAPHSHEFIEISYLWSGGCRIEVENECVDMEPGDFIILDTRSAHRPMVEGDSILINIAVDTSFFNENFFQNFDRNDVLAGFFAGSIYSQKEIKRYMVFRPANDIRVRKLITMLLQECFSDEVCRRRIMESLMMVLFSTMVRLQLEQHAHLSTSQAENSIVPELLRYMNDHLQNISREDLADHFGYSYSYISSVLQDATGMTFSKLKNSLRLNQAELLLRTTDSPITSVARDAGYSNVTSFYEMFRRQYGMSPQDYRKKTHCH